MASLHDSVISELSFQRAQLIALDSREISVTAAQLARCTRFIFESPLCVAALEDEAARWSHDLAVKTERTMDSVIKHQLFELALAMQDLEWDNQRYRWLVSPLPETAQNWGRTLSAVAKQWHRDLAGTLSSPYFSIDDRDSIVTIVDRLKTELGSLPNDGNHSELRDTIPKVDIILNTLNDFRRNFLVATSISKSLEILSLEKDLRLFYEEMSSMLAMSTLTMDWTPDSILNRFGANESLRRSLVKGAIRVTDVLLFRIKQQAVQEYVLSRLVVYLERFAKDEILSKLESKKRSAESTLQFYMDAFIFGEGLYPITHAEAANGKIDTFIETAETLFEEAEKPGNAAVLIELKQAITGASKEGIEALVNEALGQAAQYRLHLRAKARWANHKVVVVIAYVGDIRYVADRDDVYMVYLGGKTPSKAKSVLLELSAPKMTSA